MFENLYIVREMDNNSSVLVAEHPDVLPWPVALLLATRARKHVFGSRRPLDKSLCRDQVIQVGRKLKWAAVLQSKPSKDYQRIYKRGVLPCDAHVDPAVEAFKSDIMQVTMQEVKAANRKLKAFSRYDTRPSYYSYVMSWLRRCDLKVSLSDKDGTMVLLRRSVLDRLLHKELSKGSYCIESELSLSPAWNNVRETCFRLAAILKKKGCASWARELVRCISASSPEGLVSRLSCTIKTHNEVISARLLHDFLVRVSKLWEAS